MSEDVVSLDRDALTAPAQSPVSELPIADRHLERLALVYAPAAQVQGLRLRIEALGWRPDQIRVMERRAVRAASESLSFQVLQGEVISGRAGPLAASDLRGGSRRSALEVCDLFDVIFTEGDAVRATADLTGTRRRSEGRLREAFQGQLGARAPIGYARLDSGAVVFDSDPRVRDAVERLFAAFADEGTISGLLRRMSKEQTQPPLALIW